MSQVCCASFRDDNATCCIKVNTLRYAKYALITATASFILGVLFCSLCFALHPEYHSIYSFSPAQKAFFTGFLSCSAGMGLLAVYLKCITVWKKQLSERPMDDHSNDWM